MDEGGPGPTPAAGAGRVQSLRALLVGIDRYLPVRRSDIPRYPTLQGAARDVELVEKLLRGPLEVPPQHIRRLVAPFGAPSNSDDTLPTQANLVAAMLQLEEGCAAGDQALIYYSGHGGRASTARPDLKGPDGLDECLVPMDIGDPAVGYLRDFEINAWLARMEAKGVFVTLVLDCCHSGGIPRRNCRYRGIREVDRSQRPRASPVASDQEVTRAWGEVAPAPTTSGVSDAGPALLPTRSGAPRTVRTVKGGDSRWFRPRGYVLLAACRPHELAIEDSIDGGPPCGALTHHLIAALRGQGQGATYRRLYAGVVARVHVRYPAQTPVLEGEVDRLVFGRQELPTLWGVDVLAVEGADFNTGTPPARALVQTGAVQGVHVGARFAVFRAGAGDAESEPSLALGTLVEVGSTSAWLEIDGCSKTARPIREGDQAVLIDPGPAAVEWEVDLVASPLGGVSRSGECVAPECREPAEKVAQPQTALERVAAEIRALGGGRVTVCPVGEAGDFQVRVDPAFRYRIALVGRRLTEVGPPLVARAPEAAREVVRRLIHLARYADLLALDNPDSTSPLFGRLRVELEQLSADGSAPIVAEFDELSPPTPEGCEVESGSWVRLTVNNDSPDVLNVAILDFQPDWGINQVFPSSSAGLFHPLDAGVSTSISLQAFLPEGLNAGIDVLKVFAATGPLNFHWLELPALSDEAAARPAASVSRAGRPAHSAGLAASPTTSLGPGDPPSHEWATSQVELRVVRRGTSDSGS